jgi:hypothetical protein
VRAFDVQVLQQSLALNDVVSPRYVLYASAGLAGLTPVVNDAAKVS